MLFIFRIPVNLIKIHEYYILLNVPKLYIERKFHNLQVAFNSLNNKIFKITFSILKILNGMQNGTF